MATSSAMERESLVRRLEEDLIGPCHEPADGLPSRPSDLYMLGILWPASSKVREMLKEEDKEDELVPAGEEEDDKSPEVENRDFHKNYRPSSMGISFALSGNGSLEFDIEVSCATYQPVLAKSLGLEAQASYQPRKYWARRFWKATIPVNLGAKYSPEFHWDNGPFNGIYFHVAEADGLVTVVLVNKAKFPEEGKISRDWAEEHSLFQTFFKIIPKGETRLVDPIELQLANPHMDEISEEDREQIVLFSGNHGYATGHCCSATWKEQQGKVTEVSTSWLPTHEVPDVDPEGSACFRALDSKIFSAEWLSRATAHELRDKLLLFCDAYGKWIKQQADKVSSWSIPWKKETGNILINRCANVLKRMTSGAERIGRDPNLAASFRLANLAMDVQRGWAGKSQGKESSRLKWRPFQLGFILLTLESCIDPKSADRDTLDLLWFPTGGGKTEAYLGLLATTIFYSRLSLDDPDEGKGVVCIMRYTLRLLTLQQFQRAAALICACEAIRRGKIQVPEIDKGRQLGKHEFSIGMWVGDNATPNTHQKALERKLPEITCPCCGKKADYGTLEGKDVYFAECVSDPEICTAFGGTALPIYMIDEDIYKATPTLLIGTADKFAQLPFNQETIQLFAAGPDTQPRLIIQDELHLIGGPLGSMFGLYETAFDIILSHSRGGVRPKIVGSTATIRQASRQVKALFDRKTCQFPPSGISSSDSGFAVEKKIPEKEGSGNEKDDGNTSHGRLYVGVPSVGRTSKYLIQAIAGSLEQSAARLGTDSGNPCDDYWTLILYFNSLRELGGALVMMEDDVNAAIKRFAARRKETSRIGAAGMPNGLRVEELTSRLDQKGIERILRKLTENRAGTSGAIDAVLATNMLSVGIDVQRLALMLMVGQPKTVSEYIQATSRVGRNKNIPGLVVTLFNSAKVRDEACYETFKSRHQSLYKHVESASATPFSRRAQEKGLHAILVACVRHCIPGMDAYPSGIKVNHPKAEEVIRKIGKRVYECEKHWGSDDPESQAAVRRAKKARDQVEKTLNNALLAWMNNPPPLYKSRNGSKGLLRAEEENAQIEAAGKSPADAIWTAPNSLRTVEAQVSFKLEP